MTAEDQRTGTIGYDEVKTPDRNQRREEIATLVFERVAEVSSYIVARRIADLILGGPS